LSCWSLSMRSMTMDVAEKKMTQCSVVMECLEYDLRDIVGVIRFFFSAIIFLFFGSSSAHLVLLICRRSFHFQEAVRSVGCLVLLKVFYLANHIPYVPWLSTVPCKWSDIDSHGVPGIWSGWYHWCDKGSLLRFLTSVFEDLKWSIWWGMLELH
jgi:hypothetical protein